MSSLYAPFLAYLPSAGTLSPTSTPVGPGHFGAPHGERYTFPFIYLPWKYICPGSIPLNIPANPVITAWKILAQMNDQWRGSPALGAERLSACVSQLTWCCQPVYTKLTLSGPKTALTTNRLSLKHYWVKYLNQEKGSCPGRCGSVG